MAGHNLTASLISFLFRLTNTNINVNINTKNPSSTKHGIGKTFDENPYQRLAPTAHPICLQFQLSFTLSYCFSYALTSFHYRFACSLASHPVLCWVDALFFFFSFCLKDETCLEQETNYYGNKRWFRKMLDERRTKPNVQHSGPRPVFDHQAKTGKQLKKT